MEGYFAASGQDGGDQDQRSIGNRDSNINPEVMPAHIQRPSTYNQTYDQPAYSGSLDKLDQAPGYDQGVGPDFAFNGHMIHASTRTIPDEFVRVPTGTSIAEPGSILDEESGRTYHNHGTGKYFFPNDAVSIRSPWCMDALAIRSDSSVAGRARQA